MMGYVHLSHINVNITLREKKKKKKIIIEIFTFTTFLLCISLMRILGFKVFTFGVFHRQNPIILKGIYAIRNFMSG